MRKLIEYFFQKRGVDSIVFSYHFRDIAVRWKVGILTAQCVTTRERVKSLAKVQRNVQFLLKVLEK